MQALVLEEYRHLQLRTVPKPKVGAREVLVRVNSCGICGSDVHGYDGSTGRRIPPLIMGHEAAGVVAKVGGDVATYQVGDRVTFDSTVSCGNCLFCSTGAVNLCDSRQVLGVSCTDYRRNGAFAEYVSVPEHILFRLPDGFPFTHAALIEAVSIAVHAAKITDIRSGSTAAIIGTGMIGLLVLQVFRHFGCKRLLAVDLDEERLELARHFGADEVILGTGLETVSLLQSSTDGQGPDIVIDVAGTQGSILTAIESVRRGGTVTLIGNLAPKVEIPLQTIVTRQLRLLGSCASAGEYPESIELMRSGAVKVDELISAVAPLNEGPEWFSRLYAREKGLMKVILQP
jgi:L-iditol 2-dehydrogenase